MWPVGFSEYENALLKIKAEPGNQQVSSSEMCVLTQFVFPPPSHMTWCILWNQTCYLWFYFRMFSAICKRVCASVRLCAYSCECYFVTAHQISPPSYLAGVAQQPELMSWKHSGYQRDQQQNQIKCHLDRREWRDCLTAQGNGFAPHLLFWLRILFLPLFKRRGLNLIWMLVRFRQRCSCQAWLHT